MLGEHVISAASGSTATCQQSCSIATDTAVAAATAAARCHRKLCKLDQQLDVDHNCCCNSTQLSRPISDPFSFASFMRFCLSTVGASFLNSSKSMRPSPSWSPFVATLSALSSSTHEKPSLFNAAFSSSLSIEPLPSSS